MIEKLPLLTPDASRSASTLARCHNRLAAHRRTLESRNRPSSRRALITVEHLLLAGVCVVCLVSMAGNVLSIVRAL